MVDMSSSKRYLVDSGSAFSILPHKSSAEPTGPSLMTADGKPLHCWGRRTCSVRTCTREFSWTFLLAPVAFPILGADFLRNFSLLVDISNKRLVAATPPAVVPSTPSLPTVEAPSSSFLARPRRRQCPLFSFKSHRGGTQQRLIKAASDQLARWGGQETSPEVQGRRRSQQAAPPSQAHGGAPDRDHRHLACGLPLLPTGPRAAGRSQSRICRYGVPGHHSPLQEQLVNGHHPCTWWRSPTAPGGPAATTGG